MSTLSKKIVNKQSKHPVDAFIYESGLRIKNIIPVKKEDSLIVFLNNGSKIILKLSSYALLKKATQTQLDSWKLISKGIGVEWPELDEDLSLKGMVSEFITINTLKYLKSGEESFGFAA